MSPKVIRLDFFDYMLEVVMYKTILYIMASLLCAGCSTAKVAEGTSSSVSHAFERGKYVYGAALAILSPAAIGGALVYDGITLGGL